MLECRISDQDRWGSEDRRHIRILHPENTASRVGRSKESHRHPRWDCALVIAKDDVHKGRGSAKTGRGDWSFRHQKHGADTSARSSRSTTSRGEKIRYFKEARSCTIGGGGVWVVRQGTTTSKFAAVKGKWPGWEFKFPTNATVWNRARSQRMGRGAQGLFTSAEQTHVVFRQPHLAEQPGCQDAAAGSRLGILIVFTKERHVPPVGDTAQGQQCSTAVGCGAPVTVLGPGQAARIVGGKAILTVRPLHLLYGAELHVDPFSLGADYGGMLELARDGTDTLWHANRSPKSVETVSVDKREEVTWYDGQFAPTRRPRAGLALREDEFRVHDRPGERRGQNCCHKRRWPN